jgi:hypothetical protein
MLTLDVGVLSIVVEACRWLPSHDSELAFQQGIGCRV